MARFLLAQSITALCLSFVFPFATIHAATKSLESSPESGFVISADYEDLRANGPIARNGSQFTLNRPADKEESGLLKFFAESLVTKSGLATPTALLARMKWGDLTLFKVAARSKAGETTVTIPVRCAQSCIASLSSDQIPGVADPEFLLSTFAYFEEERARLIAGELPRAQSFPVTARVLPERIAPANPYPITFRANVRPVFAAKVAAWKMIVPLATVQDGSAVRLFFSTGTQIEDVQQMPINCSGGNCRVMVEDWVNYVHGVIQQPALLRPYRSMFQKTAADRAARK